MNDNISAVTENDSSMKKGFEFESSIINLNKRKWDLVVKNSTGEILNLHKNMNVGLVYEINDEHNILSFSNLTNLIEGQGLSYKPTFNIDLISEYLHKYMHKI